MRRVLLLVAAVVAGCGYHLGGTGSDLPGAAQTVSIKLFTNHTREVALEVRLRQAIEDEFRRHGPLRVVEGDDADLELSGEIRTLRNVPVAFSATDEAVQYQGVIVVGVRLTDRASGRVLRENKSLQESQDFGAVSGIVITSSPRFQRGTIDARDLIDLTNVQIGETRRREAERDLLDQVARDIYSTAVEGF